jgi:hypothetical protein
MRIFVMPTSARAAKNPHGQKATFDEPVRTIASQPAAGEDARITDR